jgi:hypothetical protein
VTAQAARRSRPRFLAPPLGGGDDGQTRVKRLHKNNAKAFRSAVWLTEDVSCGEQPRHVRSLPNKADAVTYLYVRSQILERPQIGSLARPLHAAHNPTRPPRNASEQPEAH